jgi:hypothetical protein
MPYDRLMRTGPRQRKGNTSVKYAARPTRMPPSATHPIASIYRIGSPGVRDPALFIGCYTIASRSSEHLIFSNSTHSFPTISNPDRNIEKLYKLVVRRKSSQVLDSESSKQRAACGPFQRTSRTDQRFIASSAWAVSVTSLEAAGSEHWLDSAAACLRANL